LGDPGPSPSSPGPWRTATARNSYAPRTAGLEQLLRRTLGEHITLNTAPVGGLWPVKADAGQLEQVLVNLAVNARDAMPGGGTLTIDTANITVDEAYAEGRPGLKPGRYARLRVSDTGTGMPPEVVARVFEPFFTTKPKDKGTGLGLATFYGIITGAGGYAQIYSEPGLGTTITGLLPATSEEAGRTAGPQAAAPRGRSETILLVEDEASLQELAARILTRNGYQVRAARTAAEAPIIAADTSQPIDLLLTDVVMPEMLSNEVASRIHAIRPALPVLYMSGYAQPILDTHGAFTSQIDLLEKPFTEATLLTRVRRAIDNGTHPATPPV
jgi:CheY-like chemotaxis protein